jgi:hypothetical protein
MITTIILLLLNKTYQNEYFTNNNQCTHQESNQVVPLKGKFAILYSCSNRKTSGSAICADVKKDNGYSNSFSEIITPNDANNHDSVDSDSLSIGNIVVVYTESNTGFLYFFIRNNSMTKVNSDR